MGIFTGKQEPTTETQVTDPSLLDGTKKCLSREKESNFLKQMKSLGLPTSPQPGNSLDAVEKSKLDQYPRVNQDKAESHSQWWPTSPVMGPSVSPLPAETTCQKNTCDNPDYQPTCDADPGLSRDLNLTSKNPYYEAQKSEWTPEFQNLGYIAAALGTVLAFYVVYKMYRCIVRK